MVIYRLSLLPTVTQIQHTVSQAVSRLKLSLPRACYADMTLRNAQKVHYPMYGSVPLISTDCIMSICSETCL